MSINTEMTPLAVVSNGLKDRILRTISPGSELPQPSYDCAECQDSGKVWFWEGKYQFCRKCVCEVEKLRARKLSIVPPAFRSAAVTDLQADVSRHPGQAELVANIKANPSGSYFLGGRFGTGKTYLLWSLYRHAVMQDRRTVICTLTELINEYKRFIQLSSTNQPLVYPRISAEALRQDHTRYSIFLDDLDKAKPTEYVAEQVFELADAIYAFKHQIVVTTNLSVGQLVQHFERADERFGGAIVRRLVENATIAELF